MTQLPKKDDHWLARRRTILLLKIAGILLLICAVAAQALVPVKGYFELDNTFAFAAAFGFLACAAMVFAAKILGWFIKRDERYYDD